MRPEDVDGFRRDRADSDEPIVRQLIADADQLLLREAHQIEEPPYLADRTVDYAAFWNVWYPTMWGSRRFARKARGRWGWRGWSLDTRPMLVQPASGWCPSPSGIQWGRAPWGTTTRRICRSFGTAVTPATTCGISLPTPSAKRSSDSFDDAVKLPTNTCTIAAPTALRGLIHNADEIVFLAFIGLTFHEHIPEAKKWLAWLRPVLCGLWPSWAGDDGGWAQGLSYAQAYVGIMTMFTSALKRGTGIDLYERPFWKNHARWRRAVLPAYAQWMGFGDHSERWRSAWLRGVQDLADLIGRETATDEFVGYAEALRSEAEDMTTPEERLMPGVSSELTAPDLRVARRDGAQAPSMLSVFADVGWVAIRTDPEVQHRDVAFIFRSSPFGSISHSHANNNDFILHVAGGSYGHAYGYYAGYGSDHHAHWVWHTKSHNRLTLSDAPDNALARIGWCH